MTPLFVKDDAITYVFGGEILNIKSSGLFRKAKDVWWDSRKESQIKTFKRINTAISEQGSVILDKINSAKELYHAVRKNMGDNIRLVEVAAYSSILFDTKKDQDAMLSKLIKIAKNEGDVDWVHQVKNDAPLILSIEK